MQSYQVFHMYYRLADVSERRHRSRFQGTRFQRGFWIPLCERPRQSQEADSSNSVRQRSGSTFDKPQNNHASHQASALPRRGALTWGGPRRHTAQTPVRPKTPGPNSLFKGSFRTFLNKFFSILELCAHYGPGVLENFKNRGAKGLF